MNKRPVRKRPLREVLNFVWEVTASGYRWIEVKKIDPNSTLMTASTVPSNLGLPEGQTAVWSEKGKGAVTKCLTDGVPVGGTCDRRRYAPLRDETGLFQIFAAVPASEEGIEEFASQYGLLGGEVSTPIILPTTPGQVSHGMKGRGETRSQWQEEITAMRQAVALWKMIQSSDIQKLKKYIQWEGTDAVSYDSHPDMPMGEMMQGDTHRREIIATLFQPELFARFSPGDVVEPARYYLQGVVNRHLHGRVSPYLQWRGVLTGYELNLTPHSLIGALWLQFAQAVNGEKAYRECEQCRRWFEVSPTVVQRERLFCSNACRSRAYRDRQGEARQLHQQGRSLKEIARQLNTETATAKGWIKKGKEK